MNANKIIHWATTTIMVLIFLFLGSLYFFDCEQVAGFLDNTGFLRWLICPLAVVKILGVTAVLTQN
ncbi:hypothetical protein QQ020_27570 [Fulvivirgaceae bacterium BMA12]|uniref:DoxX family protein n=1 Tax=Agaribacillus aureus TaxID=3051825 RepID=A0ABT8LDM5_9BACT|nr:hypothetical protein [Fulvivirgaceae bacterium BMA12]